MVIAINNLKIPLSVVFSFCVPSVILFLKLEWVYVAPKGQPGRPSLSLSWDRVGNYLGTWSSSWKVGGDIKH